MASLKLHNPKEHRKKQQRTNRTNRENSKLAYSYLIISIVHLLQDLLLNCYIKFSALFIFLFPACARHIADA
jgi:hypothetical protein